MTRKTYNNVVKAGKMIQKKGYSEKDSLELAIKFFDQIEFARAVDGVKMHIEPMIEKDIKTKLQNTLYTHGTEKN